MSSLAHRSMAELSSLDLQESVAQVGFHWEALRDGHVLVTGGTGFVGTWLLESLLMANKVLKLGARAAVMTRDPARFRAKMPRMADQPCVRLFTADVTSGEFPHENFSHVIHAAADPTRSRSEHEQLRTFDTIVCGTRRILDFSRSTGVPNLLFLSSGAVYGPQPQDVTLITEDCLNAPPTDDPSWSYAEAKRAAELECAKYAAQSGMRITIARCFALIGPHLPLDGPYAAGNFVRNAIRGEPITVRGDPSTVRAYLYAGDLAAWLWTMMLNSKASGTYNVGSDHPITIAELAELFASAGNVSVRIVETEGMRPSRYVPCIDRARTQLDLDVRVPLNEAIQRTLRWYLQNSYNE